MNVHGPMEWRLRGETSSVSLLESPWLSLKGGPLFCGRRVLGWRGWCGGEGFWLKQSFTYAMKNIYKLKDREGNFFQKHTYMRIVKTNF